MRDAVLVSILLVSAVPPVALLLYPLILKLLRPSRLSHWLANTPSNSISPLAAPAMVSASDRDLTTKSSMSSPSVALVTVCDQLDARLDRKLNEFVELAQVDCVNESHVGLDGVAPPRSDVQKNGDSESIALSQIVWTSVDERQGKNAVLKRIHAKSKADVLVFTDVDARVNAESLEKLLSAFDDPQVGAVTGRRVIADQSHFAKAQAGYASLDTQIRRLEMASFKSVTSCDGKLYAIRRSLLGDLPIDVTDDLYTGLGAVAAGYHLSFEPDATASIGRPARDWRHEMLRRRRVTCRGLSTLWHRRAILNPRCYGAYALALFINKGLRRLAAPCVLLATALVFLMGLSFAASKGLGFLIAMGTAVLLMGAVVTLFLRSKIGTVLYLLLGTVGMSLGVFDYLLGRRISVWTPTKA